MECKIIEILKKYMCYDHPNNTIKQQANELYNELEQFLTTQTTKDNKVVDAEEWIRCRFNIPKNINGEMPTFYFSEVIIMMNLFAQSQTKENMDAEEFYHALRNDIDTIIRETVYMDKRGVPILQGRLASADKIIDIVRNQFAKHRNETVPKEGIYQWLINQGVADPNTYIQITKPCKHAVIPDFIKLNELIERIFNHTSDTQITERYKDMPPTKSLKD